MPDLATALSLRHHCPPALCNCGLADLAANPQADLRVLRLTQAEEKKLIAHIDAIDSYPQLLRVGEKLHQQLGLTLQLAPGPNEVRTVRGIVVQLAAHPGLCRKTRQNVAAAVRRCLERHPDICYQLLDSHDLLGGGFL